MSEQEELENNDQSGKSNTQDQNIIIQEPNKLQDNIVDVISQYAKNHNNMTTQAYHQHLTLKEKTKKEKFSIIKFLSSIVTFCFFIIVLCVVIAYIAKPQLEDEKNNIIKQIENAEYIYHLKTNKYYYFPTTEHDTTLNIDISSCKYFYSYEVKQKEESKNYEIHLHGATNAFTITYYYLKTFLKEKGILE